MITENRHNEFGCLMAMIEPTRGPHIIKFGRTVIPPQILYTDPNDSSYGYDDEPHITAKYGYSPDLTKVNLATILQGIKPFIVKLSGLTQFQNEKYDVVKFDVEPNEVLTEIRRRCDCYKNEDKYPDYKPHMTLAYVQKGKFPHIKEGLSLSLPITKFKYSGQDGKKLYINL